MMRDPLFSSCSHIKYIHGAHTETRQLCVGSGVIRPTKTWCILIQKILIRGRQLVFARQRPARGAVHSGHMMRFAPAHTSHTSIVRVLPFTSMTMGRLAFAP